jgi:hypothetical protein
MYLVHIHDITYARVRMQLKRWIIEKPEGNYNVQNGSTQQCPTTVTKNTQHRLRFLYYLFISVLPIEVQ